LEGLASSNISRFKWYAFIYGFITIGIPIAIQELGDPVFGYWEFLWAVGYGLYTRWLANKMA
jgi:hypothetical protein